MKYLFIYLKEYVKFFSLKHFCDNFYDTDTENQYYLEFLMGIGSMRKQTWMTGKHFKGQGAL